MNWKYAIIIVLAIVIICCIVAVLMNQKVSYKKDIRPLFNDRDISSMMFKFDLSKYEDVRDNADAIYQVLASKKMPCYGGWSDDNIALFGKWIEQGKQP